MRRNEKAKKSNIRFIKWKDIFACFVFLFMAPIACVAKIFIHNFWLVGEEKNEARDNGYWFYKHVRERHPEQKIAYVINKKCPDYRLVKDLGKVIQWGSLSHWFWYLTAKKNISSQKGCKPNPAACYLFEVKLRLWRNKRYFLQHGITINNAKWLYNENSRFRMFVCGAKPEYEYVKKEFGYPEEAVRLLGFCRFDGLHNCESEKNSILVMPTWRSYLVRPHGTVRADDLKKHFVHSEYFKAWSEFLTNKRLVRLLEENGCKLIFYPHRNMQIFLDAFHALHLCPQIEIADPNRLSVQAALKSASCLITDFSSVCFDFAYMEKPVIFYQFDEAEFRKNQYADGYFDYHDNPLGKWSGRLDTCLDLLEEQVYSGYPSNPRVREFFALHDCENCERNYQAVFAQ
ncbi:MAG: teichoic acid biosynthesis protein B [Clostridia bacterium]|nr:teichoic acid biosynthesis protein B [Clostridia bacterium]